RPPPPAAPFSAGSATPAGKPPCRRPPPPSCSCLSSSSSSVVQPASRTRTTIAQRAPDEVDDLSLPVEENPPWQPNTVFPLVPGTCTKGPTPSDRRCGRDWS